jgi:anti-anti-sigma factor
LAVDLQITIHQAATLSLEALMLLINVENHGDLTVVECKGRIVRSESVFELRDVVMAQADADIITLDLSDVESIGGGGLGMLVFLQHWASNHGIELKLFSPSRSVMDELERSSATRKLEIASLHEMMGILAHSDNRYSLAA